MEAGQVQILDVPHDEGSVSTDVQGLSGLHSARKAFDPAGFLMGASRTKVNVNVFLPNPHQKKCHRRKCFIDYCFQISPFQITPKQ